MPGWAWAGATEDRPAVAQDAAAPPAASAPFRKSRRPSCSPCSVSLAMSRSSQSGSRLSVEGRGDRRRSPVACLRPAESTSEGLGRQGLFFSALASSCSSPAESFQPSPRGSAAQLERRATLRLELRSPKARHHVAGEQLDAPARPRLFHYAEVDLEARIDFAE